MEFVKLMTVLMAVVLIGCNGTSSTESVEIITANGTKFDMRVENLGSIEELPQQSTSLEQLFDLVPEQFASSTPIYFNDYEVERSVYGPDGLANLGTAAAIDPRPGDDDSRLSEQNSSYYTLFPAPWISGRGRYREKFSGYQYLDFDARSIESSLRFGEVTKAFEVVAAPVETEQVIRNIEGCSDCLPVSIVRNGEIASFSWDDTIAGDISRRYVPPFFDQFGHAGNLVIGDGHVVRFPKSSENDAMIPTVVDYMNSNTSIGLSDSPLYQPIIDALSRFQVLTARISTDDRSDPIFRVLLDGYLAPIVATADVVNYGDEGTRSVVALVVFADKKDRERNEKLMVARLTKAVKNGEILLENHHDSGVLDIKLWHSSAVTVALVQDAFLLKNEHLIRPSLSGQSTVLDDWSTYPPSVEVAFDLADFVFEGVVQAPQDSRWTTEYGGRPSVGDADVVLLGNTEITIVTPFPITVERIFKGKFEESEITYFLAGGQVGEDSFTVGSDFDFVREGMRAVFFFKKRISINGVMESNQLIERYELDADGTASGRHEETTLQNIELYAISFSDDQ